ncbi:tetratricopeptide repeat protein [Nocardioides sp. R-C-SC26]|uniref:tetratricopeptide repeat protein n=1 Tax=Nocardioides sp. R-C-SC26 TaxID=2870414 RepID=UPI001E4B11E7|nr:tetratricopeptide repeat protein [Nocardioides sp. R-C-SC26]
MADDASVPDVPAGEDGGLGADEVLSAPPVVFPGQAASHESAYRVAHDLLSRRAPAEALAVLEPALESEPENVGLRSLRAWAFLIRAQLRRAEEELREIVEQVPDDVWARHALGRSLERQSRYADALPHLRLAAAMSGDPEHETAVLRVERRQAELGERSFDDLH